MLPAMHRRAFLSLAAGAALAQPRRSPNLIVMFADDLGYGDLSCYGHPLIRTPRLDRMAAEGVRFTSFYAAASVCTPSRAGLLTGRYPLRAGQPENLGPESKAGLPLEEITLAQLLKFYGYRTAAFGKWHLGHQPPYLPTARGFDEFHGLPYSNDMIPPWVQTKVPLRWYRNGEAGEEVKDQSRLTETAAAGAVRFIRESGDRPFFLYLPFSMPHLPVAAAGRFQGRSAAGLYGDVIETLDWAAGRVLDTLHETGADRHTLVLFASDNGPWHDLPPRMLAGGVEPWHTGSKGLLRGAKGTTWEGGFRVPGIAWWPGVAQAGQVRPEPCSALDVFPTAAALAGAALPAQRVYDGADLMPLLRGGPAPAVRPFYYFLGRRLEAVRLGPWKLRLAPRPGAPALRELFHLERDPAEMYDVAEREPARVRELEDLLRSFAKQLGADLAA
jgi:uncharacterized sulfatase